MYRSTYFLGILPLLFLQSAFATTSEEELVVVAARLPTNSASIGDSVSVLSRDHIERLGFVQVPDLLKHIPGVSVTRSGGYGGIAQVRIRGTEANHVVVLVDGIDVSTPGTGEVDLTGILSLDIERIEVAKGPQSGLYGSNAIGGVIHITTNRGRPSNNDSRGLVTELEVGSHDRKSGLLGFSGGSERIYGALNVSYFESELDLSTDDSAGSEDDSEEALNVNGRLSWQVLENFKVDLSARHVERETDTDGFDFSNGPAQGLAIDDASVSDSEVSSFGISGTLELLDARSVTRLSWHQTDTELDARFFGDEGQRNRTAIETRFNLNERHSFTGFVEWEEEKFRNLYPFDPSQAGEQTRDLFGYGIEYRAQLADSTFANFGMRQDDGDEFDDTTTYSVDVVHDFGERVRVHGSWGLGVTNPTFLEQFGFVPAQFTGNPNLEPEEADGWDIGVTTTFLDDAVVVDVTWFESTLENEIVSLFPTVVNSAGKSDRSGIEFSFSLQGDEAQLDVSYTYLDSEDPAGGEEVRRPKNSASVSAQRRWMDNKLTSSVSATYNGGHYDTDFRDFFVNGFASRAHKLDSHTLVNAEIAYLLRPNLTVYVRAENLFDDEYEEVISYQTPGVTALFGIRASL
ncbi:MAG: TonB-dependent receptor [Pseudomonadales bacterium]|nr:TonB-dependent receptor [Pseudomonadales bacterium]